MGCSHDIGICTFTTRGDGGQLIPRCFAAAFDRCMGRVNCCQHDQHWKYEFSHSAVFLSKSGRILSLVATFTNKKAHDLHRGPFQIHEAVVAYSPSRSLSAAPRMSPSEAPESDEPNCLTASFSSAISKALIDRLTLRFFLSNKMTRASIF